MYVALSGAAFTPRVIIPDVPTAGDNFNIICMLDGVIERLTDEPALVTLSFTVIQGGARGDQSRNGSVYTLPHIFNPGMTDDVGDYRCRASIDITFDVPALTSLNILGVLQMQSNLYIYFLQVFIYVFLHYSSSS